MATKKSINTFFGEYRWLSNFHPCRVFEYPSVEHAYQASKTHDQKSRNAILMAASAYDAKRLGKVAPKRSDWEKVKLAVMEKCLRAKFTDPKLRAKLIATGEAELIEGNTWGDVYWGVCNERGENHLGILLMKIRKDLHEEALRM